MRILTRGDMDGLASTVLLTLVEEISEIRFAHPKDVQDGKVPVTDEDIIVNLPYVRGCGMWFDHHISEEEKLPNIGPFKGRYGLAPSATRLVCEHYDRPEYAKFEEMLKETDRLDSANLRPDDVTDPKGWILLAYTLDPRTGFGPEFQKYFRWLAEYIKEVSIDKVLLHPEVKKRCDRVKEERDDFLALLGQHTRQDGNVIVTDFRPVTEPPVGNRFLVYTLYPKANVEMRVFWGKERKTINVAIGHSIFNRTCKTNAGKLCAQYGGGGHPGAASCQLPPAEADKKIAEILERLKKTG